MSEHQYQIVLTNTTTANSTNWGYYDPFGTWQPTYYYSYSWPTVIYKYQVKCPKEKCGTYNWLEVDKITPCTKCKSKLKAVVEKEDFTIPVKP